MAISKTVAQELCTKLEFTLIETSFPQAIKDLTVAKLKVKAGSSKQHLDKWKDLQKTQARELAARTKLGEKVPLAPIERTNKKVQLFSEVTERFNKQIKLLEEKAKKAAAVEKKAALKKQTKVAKVAAVKAPKVLGSKGKGRHDVPAVKQQVAQSKKVSSHTKAATKRNQAKRDKR